MNKFWSLPMWQPPYFVGYKVCAVLIAILIWIYVMVTQNPLTEDTFTVPIEMRNLSSQLAIPETNRQVSVRVQGTSGVISTLSSRDIEAYIDFEGVAQGEAELPVIVVLPEHVTLVSQSPQSFAFTLETVVSETHQVDVRVSGDPAENYTLLDAVSDPDMVTISGAEANIRSISAVYVAADVTELAENYSKNLSVEVLDANGKNITDWFTISPSTINVIIPVVYDQPQKSIAVRESIVGEPALGYQVSRVVVEPSTVRVFGDLEVLNDLYYLHTAPIDVSGLKKTTSMTVAIQHGNNVSVSAEAVTVVVQIDPVKTLEFEKELLYGQNLAEGLVCAIPPLQLKVVVAGADTYIGSVSATDVVPYVDFSDISNPGSYTLPISVNLPANISLVTVSPPAVDIEITGTDEPGAEGDGPAEGEEGEKEPVVNEDAGGVAGGGGV